MTCIAMGIILSISVQKEVMVPPDDKNNPLNVLSETL
jgi:hypothetical protein